MRLGLLLWPWRKTRMVNGESWALRQVVHRDWLASHAEVGGGEWIDSTGRWISLDL